MSDMIIPDSLGEMLPRFRIMPWDENVPTGEVTQTGHVMDQTKTTQFQKVRFAQHLFEVHVEHAKFFMDVSMDEDNSWSVRLKKQCSEFLMDREVELLHAFALGVFLVGVGKYCERKEALEKVQESISHLVKIFGNPVQCQRKPKPRPGSKARPRTETEENQQEGKEEEEW